MTLTDRVRRWPTWARWSVWWSIYIGSGLLSVILTPFFFIYVIVGRAGQFAEDIQP